MIQTGYDVSGEFSLCGGPFPGDAPGGRFRLGRGRRYYVRRGGAPWAEIEAEATGNPFDTALLFGRFCCVGAGDRVFFVDLTGGTVREMSCDIYFGYFLGGQNDLYIASDSRLYRLDRDCRLCWRSAAIAVDGVVVEGMTGDTLEVSCELDPPGGWVRRRLDAATGAEMRE